MIGYVTYLKDSIGLNYLGINIPQTVIDPYLEQLKNILDDDYDEYIKYKNQRDNGHYHITLMPVAELSNLSIKLGVDRLTQEVSNIFTQEIPDINLIGIGTASKNGNTTYFIVVKSEQLQAIRNKFDLPEFDFHITIGFKYKDVFGVRKNEVMDKIDNSFLKLLKKAYYNENETFDFVKSLANYDGDENDNVYPVSLKDTYLIVKIGQSKYATIAILNDALAIAGKWESNENKPIISHTIISRKLN